MINTFLFGVLGGLLGGIIVFSIKAIPWRLSMTRSNTFIFLKLILFEAFGILLGGALVFSLKPFWCGCP